MSRDVVIEAVGVGKVFANFRRPADHVKQLLRGGRRRYCEEFWALRGVDLEVLRGETLGVVGRNGAGKSTLLQLICGTLAASSGRVQVRGRVAAMLELGAGFNRELTGRENVYLNAMILGLSEAQIAERFAAIADFAGIGAYMEQPVKHYSSGMQARLGFAVCAHVDADILVIDEILGVGDAAFQQRCMRYLQQFRRHGTVLLVSHDTAAIARLCDRVLWLDAGQVHAIGPTKEICHRYHVALAAAAIDGPTDFAVGGRLGSHPSRPVLVRGEEPSVGGTSDADGFSFDPNAVGPAVGGASIEEASIRALQCQRAAAMSGGEQVELRVVCRVEAASSRPIVAFALRDRLRQVLFGDNTYLSHRGERPVVRRGATFVARFRFRLPYLPSGVYALEAMLFDADRPGERLMCRYEDANFLRIESSHISHGLVNIAMRAIEIQVGGADETAGDGVGRVHFG